MTIKLWDVSWTGQKHNERTVPALLNLIDFAADRGYEIEKAPAQQGEGHYNLYRGGNLVAVAEVDASRGYSRGVVKGTWVGTQPSVQNIPRESKLDRFRHLLRKPAAFCLVGS